MRDMLDQARRAYRIALQEALEQIVAALSRRPEVQRVILFGSYAGGRADLLTDLDILVVMESEQDFHSHGRALRRPGRFGRPGSAGLHPGGTGTQSWAGLRSAGPGEGNGAL